MDNERDALDRMSSDEDKQCQLELPWGDTKIIGQSYDLTDPNDKQWYIECAALENEKLAHRASIENSKLARAVTEAHQLELEIEMEKVTAANVAEVVFNTACRCGTEFNYNGPANVVVELYEIFRADHSGC
jgi:hypothetical protein